MFPNCPGKTHPDANISFIELVMSVCIDPSTSPVVCHIGLETCRNSSHSSPSNQDVKRTVGLSEKQFSHYFFDYFFHAKKV